MMQSVAYAATMMDVDEYVLVENNNSDNDMEAMDNDSYDYCDDVSEQFSCGMAEPTFLAPSMSKSQSLDQHHCVPVEVVDLPSSSFLAMTITSVDHHDVDVDDDDDDDDDHNIHHCSIPYFSENHHDTLSDSNMSNKETLSLLSVDRFLESLVPNEAECPISCSSLVEGLDQVHQQALCLLENDTPMYNMSSSQSLKGSISNHSVLLSKPNGGETSSSSSSDDNAQDPIQVKPPTMTTTTTMEVEPPTHVIPNLGSTGSGGGSRKSNKKRRRNLKMLRNTAAAAAAAAAISSSSSSEMARTGNSPPPPSTLSSSPNDKKKHMTAAGGGGGGRRLSKRMGHIAVACAVESIAEYRAEHLKSKKAF